MTREIKAKIDALKQTCKNFELTIGDTLIDFKLFA